MVHDYNRMLYIRVQTTYIAVETQRVEVIGHKLLS